MGAEIQKWDSAGLDGSALWPFDYFLAVEECRSWVYRCAMGNAQKAASVPLRMYAKKGGRGQKMVWDARTVTAKRLKRLQTKCDATVRRKAVQLDNQLVEIVDHPILDLLSKKPNPNDNGFDMTTFRFLSCELTGNAYVHPVVPRGLGRPSALYPMLPQWVRIHPGEEGSDQLIGGYSYGLFSARKRVTNFAPDEVLHMKYPSIRNAYYGMGKVEACWEVLGLQHSQRKAYKAIFDNGMNPGMIVGMEGLETDAQAREATDRMNTVFRGVRNAGKIFAVGAKTTVTPIAIPPKDISQNESVLEEISGVFGYPITMLLSKAQGKANAESGEATWLKHTIDPMLRIDEQFLNHSLLPMFGDEVAENCCLAYDSPVDEETYEEAESLSLLVSGGIITPNEAREDLGMIGIEGGDELRVQEQKPTDKKGGKQDGNED